MGFGVLETVKTSITRTCYAIPPAILESTDASDTEAIKTKIVEGAKAGFTAVESYLGDKEFLIGSAIKWVDFYLFELLERFTWLMGGGTALADFSPKLNAYHRRIFALPGVQEQQAKELPLPFNNKSSKINGTGFKTTL